MRHETNMYIVARSSDFIYTQIKFIADYAVLALLIVEVCTVTYSS